MRLGILGAGHLAAFCCEGLRKADWAGQLLVSPHNPVKAKQFEQTYGATIAESNQELLEQVDAVLVAVRPDNVAQLLTPLHWPQGKLLISTMAGVSITAIKVLAPDADVVRSMPISAASINASPTTIYPDHSIARELYALLGSVIPVETEEQFEVITANAAAYGWLFALMNEMIKANCDSGISIAQATLVVTKTLEAAAKVAGQDGLDMERLINDLQTPGGITEYGMRTLFGENAITPWSNAFSKVVTRLRGGG